MEPETETDPELDLDQGLDLKIAVIARLNLKRKILKKYPDADPLFRKLQELIYLNERLF